MLLADRYPRLLALFFTSLLIFGSLTFPAPSLAASSIQQRSHSAALADLTRGQPLKLKYSGMAKDAAALQQGRAAPVSLLASDLDLDGAADLIAGYSDGRRGLIGVTRGNPQGYAPKDSAVYANALRGNVPPSFSADTRVFAVPESPDFMVAGDFRGTGGRDLLVGHQGGGLYLLPSDGHGGFLPATRVSIGGGVSALAANDAGQVAAGVTGAGGNLVLVFDRRHGVLANAVASYWLLAPATSLAWGYLGSGTSSDLAVGAGNSLVVIYNAVTREAKSDTVQLGFETRSVVIGDFIWDRDHRMEIAALDGNGAVHLVQHGSLKTSTFSPSELAQQRAAAHTARPTGEGGAWSETRQLEFAPAGIARVAPQSRLQVSALSGQPSRELLVLDSALNQVRFTGTHNAITLGTSPVAAQWLPAKLNGSRDLVVLTSGSTTPQIYSASSGAVLSVGSNHDEDDAGGCSAQGASLGDAGPDGALSLREAVCEANSAPGQTITILLPSGNYGLGLVPSGSTTDELELGTQSGADIFLIGSGTPADTIIQQTDGAHRVMSIDPNGVGNIAATILNISLIDGATNEDRGGGALLAGGAGDAVNLSNVVVSNSVTSPSSCGTGGGGGVAFSGGGTLIIAASTISNNLSTGCPGGGLYYDQQGNAGNLTITNAVFDGNTSDGGSGAAHGGGIWSNSTAGDSAIVAGSMFTKNVAKGSGSLGGAFYNAGGGELAISSSRIVGNTSDAAVTGVYSSGIDATATENWWGCNSGPGASGCDNVGSDTATVSWDPYVVLTLTPDSASIPINGSTIVTAAMTQDSAGNTGFSVPNGTPVVYGGTLGTLNPSSAFTLSGKAIAVYTAGSTSGTGTATATVDNATASTNITITANVGGGDFTLAAAPASATIKAGQSAGYTVTVTSLNGFGGAVTLSCSSGLPGKAACQFAPSSVTPGTVPATSTLTITTVTNSTASAAPLGSGSGLLYAVWLGIPGMLVSIAGVPAARRRKLLTGCLVLLLIAFCLVQGGCGSSGSGGTTPGAGGGGGQSSTGTPPGNYTVTISASSGSLTHTATIDLIVQ